MKKIIKRATAMAFSVVGILSTMPSGFCAPDEKEVIEKGQSVSCAPDEKEIIEKGHLDRHSMMVVAKYFQTPEDLVRIAMARKRFREIPDMFNYNPVKPYDGKITPNAKTCFVDSSKGDKPLAFPEYNKLRKELNFVRTYFRSGITKKTSQPKENPYALDESSYVVTNDSIKRIIYKAGTFTREQFELALQLNCVCEATGWNSETVFVKKDDPYGGVDLVFTSENEKQLVFQFRPQGTVRKDSSNPNIVNYNINKIAKYNSLLKEFGIVDKKFHVQNRGFKK